MDLTGIGVSTKLKSIVVLLSHHLYDDKTEIGDWAARRELAPCASFEALEGHSNFVACGIVQ
jgi:hypothetical protein